MLTAERFVLLALDPVSGRIALPRADTRADALAAAGLLVDLLAQQRLVQVHDGRFVVDATLPPGHPLLGLAATVLAPLSPVPASEAIRQVERRLAPLARDLLEGLHRRDFLHRQRDWQFWRADALRYPLRSLQARNDAASVLRQASDGAGGITGIGLLVLADVAGVLTTHLDAGHHERASRRLLGLNAVERSDEFAGVAALRNALLA